MTGYEILKLSVQIIFIVNGVLLVAVLTSKAINRRRTHSHKRRRSTYLEILSRHLSSTEQTVSLGPLVAEDEAFLDAVIDLRDVLAGPEVAAIDEIVDRFGISEQQSTRLRRRTNVGRRLRAAVALAELGDQGTAPALMEHLNDREPEIRIQSARGLARIGWTPAIEAILDRMEIEDAWVRSRFADTLITFGSVATWPLISYIKTNHRLFASGVPTAIRILAAIGDPEAIAPTIEILDRSTDIEIQLAAVETIGVLGIGDDIYPVEKAARAEDWRLRAKAAKALAQIEDVSVLPTLVLGLNDANLWVRRNAAFALAATIPGREILYQAVTLDDLFARDAAVEALADVGEVIAARDRIGGGIATSADFDLIEYVDGKKVLST